MLALSSGTHLYTEYRIAEYIAGVPTAGVSGTLNQGDPDAVELFPPALMGAAYTIQLASYFSDGAISNIILPLERTALGTLESVAWKTPLASIQCREAVIEMLVFAISGGRSVDPQWVDGDGNSIGSGIIITGEIPEAGSIIGGYPINMIFTGGIDLAQWSDFPSSFAPYQVCGAGFSMIDCGS